VSANETETASGTPESTPVGAGTFRHPLGLPDLRGVYHLAVDDEDAAVGLVAGGQNPFGPLTRSSLGVNTSLSIVACAGWMASFPS